VIVARRGDRGAEQIAVVIDCAQNRDQENQKLQILLRGPAGLEQIAALTIAYRPVVVFAAAVDAGEGLFMQEQGEIMAVGDALEDLHDEMVAVRPDIGLGVDRHDLELVRRHLVVARLGRDPHLVEFGLGVLHEGQHPLLDGAEIVVLKLLPLGRPRADEGAAGDAQVRTQIVESLVDEKILLLRADGGDHPAGAHYPKEGENLLCGAVDGLHRPQQRRLFVEGLAGIADEDRWNAEDPAAGPFHDEGRTRGVPHGVAARFKSRTHAAAGEGRGVRFALDELLAAEALDDAAILLDLDKSGVLLRRRSGLGLEPVGEMGYSLAQRPLFHRMGDRIGDRHVELFPLADGGAQLFIDLCGQLFAHHLIVETVDAVILGGVPGGEIVDLVIAPDLDNDLFTGG